MSGEKDRRVPTSSRHIRILRNPATAWFFLLVGLVLTFAGWHLSTTYLKETARQRFLRRVEEIKHTIAAHMTVYEQVLWGCVGLFNASELVTPEEWHAYLTALQLGTHWPGIEKIGYCVPVMNEERGRETSRAQPLPQSRREARAPEYSAVIYLESDRPEDTDLIGYDLWKSDVLRVAMERARDRGEAATSGRFTFPDPVAQRPTFLMFLPLYLRNHPIDTLEARREGLEGWVFGAFQIDELMKGILRPDLEGVAFQIYDGERATPETLMYDSQKADGGEGAGDFRFEERATLHLQGHPWTLVFVSRPGLVTQAERREPILIAIVGGIVDLVIFYVLVTLLLLHRRAYELAREMTREIGKARDELAQGIVEREGLIEALTRSNEELSRFAYVASHDLQEPLRTIVSFTELLERRYGPRLDEKGKDYLRTAAGAAERMGALISSLLTYARLDRETTPPVLIDCREEVERILEYFRPDITQRGGRITCEPLPTLTVDPVRFLQIFQNLIGNALKYAKPDLPPEIRIGSQERENEVIFFVEDNGIGIEAAYLSKIFEPFERLHPPGDPPGTGLGLAICKRIVERMGGRIWAESEVGKGSTFFFSIPKVPPTSEDSPSPPR
ncbi:MAG: hypothetical protein D6795_13185 [Deltaproteobacteria bacterium]|nr:MAG: hypothetical protein D6795_13185 [Deltaproteobacteria bacterium]